MKACKLVAYYRVSTDKQGRSGLGIEAQRAAIEAYARSSGCSVAASYTEVESGSDDDRPELARALTHARRSKATLVIAKLDRLSRNAAFLMKLQEGSVRIVCCDMPEADETMIGIMAVFAQRERKMISIRTRDALAAAKARGVLLGAADPRSHRFTADDSRKGAEASARNVRDRMAEEYADVAEVAVGLAAEGLSQSTIAGRLNDQGHAGPNGQPWKQYQVCRLLKRQLATA